MKERNKQTMLMVQIESIEAVGNAEAVAQVEGVDALFVGYADLCQNMGIDPDPRHPRCAEAISHVGNAIGKTGKTGALSVSDPERIPLYRDLGFTLFVCGIDTIIMKNAMVQLAASLKMCGLP
jgi:2-keto-3-deoxy-L-rhamnonate aldolase RhmA